MSCVVQARPPTTTSMTPTTSPALDPRAPPVIAPASPVNEMASGTTLFLHGYDTRVVDIA